MSTDSIWAVLRSVMDPEIPVVSVVDLGIVREVTPDQVTITPTYSGCPATDVIERTIREELDSAGYRGVAIKTVLSPPWTTDWIAPEGKRKLAQFGIAPPHAVVNVAGISRIRKATVPCPRCGSKTTSLLSQFGSTACKAQYRCDDCREPFDYFKPH